MNACKIITRKFIIGQNSSVKSSVKNIYNTHIMSFIINTDRKFCHKNKNSFLSHNAQSLRIFLKKVKTKVFVEKSEEFSTKS